MVEQKALVLNHKTGNPMITTSKNHLEGILVKAFGLV